MLLGLGLTACDGTGEVSIRFRLPSDAGLSPVDERLAEITLVTTNREGDRSLETREVIDREAGLEMGVLPAGGRLRVAVELRSPAQRLIGFGQSAGEIEVGAGDVEIAIEVRRPFVYLAGQAMRLEVFDPTLDTSEPFAATIALESPRAVAPSADGSEVVVVSASAGGGTLRLLSTSDHLLGSTTVPLVRLPRDVAVSPDGRWALVGLDGADGGLSIVDLVALRSGVAGTARFLPLGPVGTVATTGFEEDARGVALLARATAACANQPYSSLVLLSMGGAPAVLETLDLGAPIGDLALTEAGEVVVADGCGDRLAEVALADGELTTLVDLPGASAVAAVGDRVWGAGVAQATASLGRRVTMGARARGEGGETRIELAPAQERIESIEFSGREQTVEVAMDADELAAVELAALPGSDLVALTTRGYYHADESGDFLGSPVVPEMEITTHEYLLVDASNQTVVQRVRTSCDGFLLTEAVLTEFVCSTAPDQETITFADSFEPSQIAVLYGGR
jgi:hypothetical protein